jgi:hypothetical protein
MKTIFTISFFLFSFFISGQTKGILIGKPATLEQTYKYLDRIFDDVEKYSFKTLPEDIATSRLHFGLGMWIRNKWGLWGNSKLKNYFLDKDVHHPDDMSGIILTSYHRYLNNRPVDLDGQIKKYNSFYEHMIQKEDTNFLSDFLKGRTPDSALLNYFPVGDTILVSIWARSKNPYSENDFELRGLAEIEDHHDKKLLIKIIEIRRSHNRIPERNVGDIYEERPIDCDVIPKGWKLTKK